MKELFLAICGRINTVLPDSFKIIDLFADQVNRSGESNALRPACYIDMLVNWQGKGQGVQEGAVELDVYIVVDHYNDTYSGSPKQQEGLADIFDLAQLVYIALQGLEGELFSSLLRISTDLDSNYTHAYTVKHKFECTIIDSDVRKQRYTRVPHEQVINK